MTTRTRSPASASPRPRPPKGRTTSPRPAPLPAEPTGPSAAGGAVTLAVVTGAHGIGGEVRLKLFTDDLVSYASFNGGTLTLRSLRGDIARFAEVADRTAAEALRGTALTVPREALPSLDEGEYYHADLIGLPVVTADGAPVGRVVSVDNFGAGDVIEVETVAGKRFMAPLSEAAVPEWNAERLVIEPGYVDA